METKPKRGRTAKSCPPGWASLVLGAAMLGACASENAEPLQPSEAAGAPAPPPPAADPTTGAVDTPSALDAATSAEAPSRLYRFEGWLSIIWNEEPHFFLTDDEGHTIELLLDEAVTAPPGGPLALNRTRVIVLAVVTQAHPELYEARSIIPAEEG